MPNIALDALLLGLLFVLCRPYPQPYLLISVMALAVLIALGLYYNYAKLDKAAKALSVCTSHNAVSLMYLVMLHYAVQQRTYALFIFYIVACWIRFLIFATNKIAK